MSGLLSQSVSESETISQSINKPSSLLSLSINSAIKENQKSVCQSNLFPVLQLTIMVCASNFIV